MRDREAVRDVAWHALAVDETFERLETSERGLTSPEVAIRRAAFGANRLAEAQPTSPLVTLLHQFASPLIYLLLVALVVTLVLAEFLDAIVIAVVLALNAVIGFVQERQAEESVRALMQLLSPHARVVREGRDREVDSAELVPGDLVLLESGVRVPADLRLVDAVNLEVDESLLTGESVTVAKSTRVVGRGVALPDRRNLAFTGTTVTTGRARGIVVATGEDTQLGSVAEHIRTEVGVETPLQRRMARFAQVIAVACGAASALLFGAGVVLGEPVKDMFLAAVALAVAVVPEGLPIAFTVALALGVRRMARRNAVIRRLAAVETLGSATVIGSDKTGTLTENRMTVEALWTGSEIQDLAGARADPLVDDLLVAGVLAVEAEAFRTDGGWDVHGDPTEIALVIAAEASGIEPDLARERHREIARIPFEAERRYGACIRDVEGHRTMFVVGAPERIVGMCDRMRTPEGEVPLDAEQVHAAARAMGQRALRVLAIATGARDDTSVDPDGLVLLGLEGMLDPPRAGVADAIAGCRAAGMRVVMITGDHAITAAAIAARLGLDVTGRVYTGSELEHFDDDELGEVVACSTVFARVAPEHKLRIVRALQRRGEVVGVTGDGVNDAPALKRADIGIAMGRDGTDVAREAADMVLTDDDFVSIYAAVEEGRVTFDNVRRVTFFLLSTGAASLFAILAAVFLRWPLPLLPAQLLWLNLVTNSLQDVALAFEPGEPDVLDRPPRPRGEGLITSMLWTRTAIAGGVMAVGMLLVYRWELDQTGSETAARTVALTTFVLAMALHVGSSRSERRSVFTLDPIGNRFLVVAQVGALAIHVAAMYFPPTQALLRIEPVSLGAWVRMVLVASTVLLAVELHKAILRRRAP